MKRVQTLILIWWACLGVASLAAAPLIELSNGTKLVGTIEKREGDKVYIRADLLGLVVVDAAAVVSPAAESAAVAALPPSDLRPAAPAMAAPAAPTVATTTPRAGVDKPVWKRSLAVNGSYTSATYVQGAIPGAPPGLPFTGADVGLQGTQSLVQVSGMLLRATPTQALTLTGSYGYAKYQPAGKVLDNWAAEFTYTRILSPRTYLLARSSYKVDKISLVDHSFEQILGYGYKLVDTERTHLDIIPGLSGVHERKGSQYDGDWILSVGFLENLKFIVNERVSLEQRFKYRIGVEESDVWAINAYLGVKSALTEHLSLTVGATYTYDNVLGPLPATLAAAFLNFGLSPEQVAALRPAKKDQLLITSGLEYSW